jgi:diaminopimelate epimerase
MTPTETAAGGDPMPLRFTKLHGLGNNYIYLDLVNQQADLNWPQLAKAVSNVNFGLGSDGLILILPGTNGADFRMRIFNADGSEGLMCGNGIRSVGKYVYDHQLTTKQNVLIDTLSGVLELQLQVSAGKAQSARVNMGKPRFLRREIPMLGDDPDSDCREQPITAGDATYSVTALSMGNPHAVIFVDDVEHFPVSTVGPMLENHPLFPSRINVEFARVTAPGHIEMRVWERGSGQTFACGTGACATAVAAITLGKTTRKNQVHLQGGVLEIEWGDDGHIYMTGPAVEIASGEFNTEWLAAALAGE